MEILEGAVRAYDWGSTTAIPELLGRSPSGEPVAELWLGAHPSAPASVGAAAVPLDRLITADPARVLGTAVAERFGELPFLLKVLAAAEPLSLQAHPSASQARDGFARENERGVPLDAPERSFRDASHKPELICALSEFDALCGFRDAGRSLELLEGLSSPALDPVLARLRSSTDAEGLARVLEWLLTREPGAARGLVAEVVEACAGSPGGPFAAERATAVALGARYPGDAGVVTALLLNLVRLQPHEALFLGSGNLHMYLRGTAVEVMANSDNVVRGGLTGKHVDVPTLLDVVDATPIEPRVQRPPVVDGIAHYDSPVSEFSLDRIEVDGAHTLDPGPAVLLCTAGAVEADVHVLDRGTAAWMPASDGPITLRGRATVYRCGVGRSSA